MLGTQARKLLHAGALLLVSMIGAPSALAVCYVNASASGAHSGASWTDAYTDLQSALGNAACTEIWVHKGIYKPTTGADQAIGFSIPSGVAVYGGFAGAETLRTQRDWIGNPTILSGDIDNNDNSVSGVDQNVGQIVGSNSHSIVYVASGSTSSTVLDGITITGGNGGFAPSGYGAGLFCDGFAAVCSPTIRNVVFIGNNAFVGGALFMESQGGDSSPLVSNVTFANNHASSGGAVGNRGDGSPTFDHVVFNGNSSDQKGGAIRLIDGIHPLFKQTSFVGNSAVLGGAVNVDSDGITSTYANVTFYGNTSSEFGAVSYSVWNETSKYYNVTMSGNSSFNGNPNQSFLTSNGTAEFHNVIIWGNANIVAVYVARGVIADHSVVEGGCSTMFADPPDVVQCTNMLTSDPNLTALGNYGGYVPTMRLNSGSSAIDTGDDTVCAAAPVNGVDERDVSRPVGLHCDIGAVEYSIPDDTVFANGFDGP
jgi:predicted outer membrane repeat protein